jgi:small subunit ribosomal protein S24e
LKVEIQSKKENVLQERTEVQFQVDHDGEPTPTRDSLRSKIAELMNVQKERVVIDHLDTEYGKGASAGYSKVYASVEVVKSRESKHQQIRHGLIEKPKKEKKVKAARPTPAEKKPAEKKPVTEEKKPAAEEKKPATAEKKPAAAEKK